MRNKKLIVNADDWGQSTGINEGIIKAYEQGIVTSTSLMVRYPAATDAATYSMNNPSLDVGLHADLGEWYLKDGEWMALYEVVSLDDPDKVIEELNRQVGSFYRIMKRNPTHIDSHQHVHLRESVRPVFERIAGKLNIPLRHCSREIKYCGDFYGQHADGSPNHERIGVTGLKQVIEHLPEGITELACHPGLDISINTMYRNERETEVNSLCNPEIRAAIQSANIELCSFKGFTF